MVSAAWPPPTAVPDSNFTLQRPDPAFVLRSGVTIGASTCSLAWADPGSALAFGDLSLGVRKTSATVIVGCGTFTKAYTVKLTPAISRFLYANISVIDAQRERLAGTAAAASPAASPADVLAQLIQLHEADLLTNDEFAAKRAEVISRI